MQNTWHTPTTSFFQNTNFHGASRTISDFVSGVTNPGLIPSKSLQNNGRSPLQTQNLWPPTTTSFSQSTHFYGTSRTLSDIVSGVTNTSLTPSKSIPNNAFAW
ncbi:hypothetical protein H5410_014478 [Solanum commersonii]|uniref:Uncharacterized protein n=1 Tax=Solanum commersonii TaxID=4109 RepID=A0A9J5ZR33_SOLCO|nr:hypothetical protein H5410_014478 [Solanum commersonii]